jgi:Family of unknown function (DUF6516)
MARGPGQSSRVTLFRYLSRLYDTVSSRDDVEIESLDVPQPSRVVGRLTGRVRFADGSLLEFAEVVRSKGKRGVEKEDYTYHYQRADGKTIFRYDKAPHHREVKSFPHHKHTGAKVEAADAPDLHEVLREIDRYLRTRRVPS